MNKIPVADPIFNGNEIKYLTECIKTSWVSSGKFVATLEEKFADFCGTRYACATSNGTSALHLLLVALGIKEGDEVLVPDLTYVSSANAVAYTGAKPVFVDVDKEIWAMDPEKIEKKITKKTKAILVVHLYGHPADMDKINSIAKKHKLIVLEDACQVHGALYKGRKAGSLSKAACFSFSGAKIMTTGEGGMITTNDKALVKRINDIRSNFTSKKKNFYHSSIGYNYRMTNLQGAVGVAQLEKIESKLRIKIRNAKTYTKFLKDVDLLQLPVEKPWAKNTYWLYSIVLKKRGLRDKLAEYLKSKGIETRPFFVPMHKLPMYKTREKLVNTEYLAANGISLPSGLSLTSAQIEYICSEIKNFIKKNA